MKKRDSESRASSLIAGGTKLSQIPSRFSSIERLVSDPNDSIAIRARGFARCDSQSAAHKKQYSCRASCLFGREIHTVNLSNFRPRCAQFAKEGG